MAKKIIAALLVILALAVAFFFYASGRSSTVVVEHTFDAPIEKIWQMWNDPETIKQWWSPKGYTAPVVKNDFRVGGSYTLSMLGPNGKTIWNVGTYTEIIPNQKIVSTMAFADEQGQPVPASHYGVPGKWPDEVGVMAEFTEIDGKTHVKITETGIPLIMSLFSKMGWKQQFEKFDALLK